MLNDRVSIFCYCYEYCDNVLHKWTVLVFSPGRGAGVIYPDQSSKDDQKGKHVKDEDDKDERKEDIKEGVKVEDIKEDKKDKDFVQDKKEEGIKEVVKIIDKNEKEDGRVEFKNEEKKDVADKEETADKNKDDKRVRDDKDKEDMESRVVNPKTDEQRCRLQEACRDVLLFTILDQVSKGQIPD